MMAERPHEERLTGGFINEVVRVGDTVRRAGPQVSDFAPRLLRFLDERGWTGAPRYLGIDDEGRQILGFIEGIVPTADVVPDAFKTDEALAEVARMVRGFHDLTAGSDLADEKECICHNDLSPKNTVYRSPAGIMLPVAFIDWDIAEPGSRIHDIAMVCWKYLDLGPSVPHVGECSRRMRLICDAYGVHDRSGLMDTIIWWQESTVWGIEYGAAKGTEALIRLRDGGFAEVIRRNMAWVQEHRAGLEWEL
jgi:hypothetical protein